MYLCLRIVRKEGAPLASYVEVEVEVEVLHTFTAKEGQMRGEQR